MVDLEKYRKYPIQPLIKRISLPSNVRSQIESGSDYESVIYMFINTMECYFYGSGVINRTSSVITQLLKIKRYDIIRNIYDYNNLEFIKCCKVNHYNYKDILNTIN